jgi:hypothetical protein
MKPDNKDSCTALFNAFGTFGEAGMYVLKYPRVVVRKIIPYPSPEKEPGQWGGGEEINKTKF